MNTGVKGVFFVVATALLSAGSAFGNSIGVREKPLLNKGQGLLLYKGFDNSPYAFLLKGSDQQQLVLPSDQGGLSELYDSYSKLP